MRLLAKSSCDQIQLIDRKNKGFKHIEIQLTADFFSTKWLEDYQHIMATDWDIRHIHMPFIPKESDLPLEFICHPEHTRVFFKVCALAEACAKYYGHPISIIMHTNIPYDTMQYLPQSLDKIIEIFKIVMSQYKDITFSIENGALYSVRNNNIRINPSSLDANVQWANFFNKTLKTNRFKTTIDICHILMTRNALNFLTEHKNTADLEKTIAWFFEQNKDTIDNIHLNNMHISGIRGDHGASFDEYNLKDIELLAAVRLLCEQFNIKCDITLEVEELDHNNAINAHKLKALLEKISAVSH